MIETTCNIWCLKNHLHFLSFIIYFADVVRSRYIGDCDASDTNLSCLIVFFMHVKGCADVLSLLHSTCACEWQDSTECFHKEIEWYNYSSTVLRVKYNFLQVVGYICRICRVFLLGFLLISLLLTSNGPGFSPNWTEPNR